MLTGEVTALEVDADASGKFTVVRGYDPGHRLLRHRRVAGYPNMTASDIVRRLAGRNKLSLGKVEATRTVYELATQPNITDWDFLPRLAQENDVHVSFDPKGKFQFGKLDPASVRARATPHRPRRARTSWSSATTRCTAGSPSPPPGRSPRRARAAGTCATKRAAVRRVPGHGEQGHRRRYRARQRSASRSEPSELTATDTPFTTQAQVTHAAARARRRRGGLLRGAGGGGHRQSAAAARAGRSRSRAPASPSRASTPRPAYATSSSPDGSSLDLADRQRTAVPVAVRAGVRRRGRRRRPCRAWPRRWSPTSRTR